MLSHVDDVLSAEAMLKVRPSPGIPGKPSRTVCMNESATFVLSVVGHSQGGQQCERRGQDVSRFLRRVRCSSILNAKYDVTDTYPQSIQNGILLLEISFSVTNSTGPSNLSIISNWLVYFQLSDANCELSTQGTALSRSFTYVVEQTLLSRHAIALIDISDTFWLHNL